MAPVAMPRSIREDFILASASARRIEHRPQPFPFEDLDKLLEEPEPPPDLPALWESIRIGRGLRLQIRRGRIDGAEHATLLEYRPNSGEYGTRLDIPTWALADTSAAMGSLCRFITPRKQPGPGQGRLF